MVLKGSGKLRGSASCEVEFLLPLNLYVCVYVCVGDYDRLCPGGPGFRPNGGTAVLEGQSTVLLNTDAVMCWAVLYRRLWHIPHLVMLYSLATELIHFGFAFTSFQLSWLSLRYGESTAVCVSVCVSVCQSHRVPLIITAMCRNL